MHVVYHWGIMWEETRMSVCTQGSDLRICAVWLVLSRVESLFRISRVSKSLHIKMFLTTHNRGRTEHE